MGRRSSGGEMRSRGFFTRRVGWQRFAERIDRHGRQFFTDRSPFAVAIMAQLPGPTATTSEGPG